MPGMVSIASPNGASDKPVSEGAKSTPTSTPVAARRTLLAASVAHAVHDGMTDLIYVLLPLWQSQFGLSLAFTGALRGLYAACMAGFQVPATRLAQRWGRPALLVGGTVLVALAYLVAGLSGALPVVCGALLLGGWAPAPNTPWPRPWWPMPMPATGCRPGVRWPATTLPATWARRPCRPSWGPC